MRKDFLNEEGLEFYSTSREFSYDVHRINDRSILESSAFRALEELLETYRHLLHLHKFAEWMTGHIIEQLSYQGSDARLPQAFYFIRKACDILNPEQIRKIERVAMRKLLSMLSDESVEEASKLSTLHRIADALPTAFNQKVFLRLLNSFDSNHPRLSHQAEYETGTIGSTEIISLLKRYDWGIHWEKLQAIIQRCTPPAKSIMRRFLYGSAGGIQFILDENMEPMDAHYENPDLHPKTLVSPRFHTLGENPENGTWYQIFNEFKIVPIVNYWGETKTASIQDEEDEETREVLVSEALRWATRINLDSYEPISQLSSCLRDLSKYPGKFNPEALFRLLIRNIDFPNVLELDEFKVAAHLLETMKQLSSGRDYEQLRNKIIGLALKEQDDDEDYATDKLLTLKRVGIISERLFQRLLYRLNPLLNIISKPKEDQKVTSDFLVSMLSRIHTYGELRKLIERMTDGAKRNLQRVLFKRTDMIGGYFLLDETLMPMGEGYQTLSLGDEMITAVFGQLADSNAEPLLEMLAEMRLVPLGLESVGDLSF